MARSHYDHERVAVSRLSPLYLALDIALVPLFFFGVPCPSLYKLEGRVICGVVVGLAYLVLQAGFKSGS